MKLKEEHASRKVDPFELQVFKEQCSNQLKTLEEQQRRTREQDELEQLSHVAPTAQYQGFNKTRIQQKKRKQIKSLPKFVRENLNQIQFGCGTLPSDNMNMVMTHEFEHAFVKKMRDRQNIERELDRLAHLHEKNAKYNVYLTKGE